MRQNRSQLNTDNTKVVLAGITVVLVFLFLIFPHTRLANCFQKGIEETRIFINSYDCVECVEKHDSAYLRPWMEALIIIKDHPLTGLGPEGYRKIITEWTETLFLRNIFIAFYLIMLAAIISASRTESNLILYYC